MNLNYPFCGHFDLVVLNSWQSLDQARIILFTLLMINLAFGFDASPVAANPLTCNQFSDPHGERTACSLFWGSCFHTAEIKHYPWAFIHHHYRNYSAFLRNWTL